MKAVLSLESHYVGKNEAENRHFSKNVLINLKFPLIILRGGGILMLINKTIRIGSANEAFVIENIKSHVYPTDN